MYLIQHICVRSPQLTWRDIQHLTVLTSKRNSLFDAKERFHWTMNGVGLEFNHLFGFGVLDAGAIVTLSKQWRTVPPRYHCEAGSVMGVRCVYPHYQQSNPIIVVSKNSHLLLNIHHLYPRVRFPEKFRRRIRSFCRSRPTRARAPTPRSTIWSTYRPSLRPTVRVAATWRCSSRRPWTPRR